MHMLGELWLFINCFFEIYCAGKQHPRCYGPVLDNRRSKNWHNFQITSYHFFEVDDLFSEHRAKNCENQTKFTSNSYPRCKYVPIKLLWSSISRYLVQPWFSSLLFELVASRSFLWSWLSPRGMGIKKNRLSKPPKNWSFCTTQRRDKFVFLEHGREKSIPRLKPWDFDTLTSRQQRGTRGPTLKKCRENLYFALF
jgi:hypothetical protein